MYIAVSFRPIPIFLAYAIIMSVCTILCISYVIIWITSIDHSAKFNRFKNPFILFCVVFFVICIFRNFLKIKIYGLKSVVILQDWPKRF